MQTVTWHVTGTSWVKVNLTTHVKFDPVARLALAKLIAVLEGLETTLLD